MKALAYFTAQNEHGLRYRRSNNLGRRKLVQKPVSCPFFLAPPRPRNRPLHALARAHACSVSISLASIDLSRTAELAAGCFPAGVCCE
eukprot:171827-Pleurochrysis_carterae.AAC.1